jgi:ATP phosphoribosyltransferase
MMLKVAVQKSERISKPFLELLSKCGLKIEGANSKLYYKFDQLPIELFFIRGSDIPTLLKENFDLAILGKDSFFEYNLPEFCEIQKNLGFAKARLSFAGKTAENFMKNDLNGKKIATSYPTILENYLDENQIDAQTVEMHGSVESSIKLGISDLILDIIQTGSTLLQHSLCEYFPIMELEAVIVTKKGFNSEILEKLLFRINAVLNGKPCKYVMFNLKKSLVEAVVLLLPAGKSPTILNLANEDFCAIHTLCNEDEIWKTCEILQKNGAQDILISDINLRFL